LKAIKSGQFQGHTEIHQVNDLKLKDVTISYHQESREGDTLQFGCWQDKANPYIIFCVVQKGQQNITTMKMEFYGQISGGDQAKL
jgi:hypothetical protein